MLPVLPSATQQLYQDIWTLFLLARHPSETQGLPPAPRRGEVHRPTQEEPLAPHPPPQKNAAWLSTIFRCTEDLQRTVPGPGHD